VIALLYSGFSARLTPGRSSLYLAFNPVTAQLSARASGVNGPWDWSRTGRDCVSLNAIHARQDYPFGPSPNYSKLARFSDACGAEIPRWIRKQLEAYGDDANSIQAFGEQVISEMCERLLDGGAPGLHFYTLNQSEPSLAIWNNLKLPR